MKHFYSILVLLLSLCANASAQGWPANYKGVMLQAFYWDSYSDTQWTNLESQADELSQYFDLIWVPQSGYCNTLQNQMGYAPIWWFRHDSAFGSETELRKMIKTFKDKGTGVIEDVVINHRKGNHNWCDFPEEKWKGQTMHWSLADICQNDDGGNTKRNGYDVSGAMDTGDDFLGCRDLDHTSDNVRKNVKLYLRFLKEELGYTGFRYDMVKGFAAKYIGEYNASAQPTYSVGEYWDGDPAKLKSWIDGTKVDGKIQSAAFDFALKYYIKDALGDGQWNRLDGDCPAKDPTYSRYAVTFVDNHDTDRDDNRLKANYIAANAYIMAMPGTPCVFLTHWKQYKTQLKKLILARKAAGISNQSAILKSERHGNGYIVNVQGEKGNVLLALGTPDSYDANGYKIAVEGDGYKYYVADNVDISAVQAIADEEPQTFTPPTFCTIDKDERCAFFEAPSFWTGTVSCWQWDQKANYTGGSWPGADCRYVGTTKDGNKVYKWSWNKQTKPANNPNAGIIFNCDNGSEKTADLEFVNGGYYDIYSGAKPKGIVTTPTGIKKVHGSQNVDGWYTIGGVKTNKPTHKGVYIHNGKKVVVN